MKSLALVAALALMSSACAYGVGSAGDSRGQLDLGGAVHLNVSNHSGGPMELYAVGAGTQYRIGSVQPGLDRRFVLRPGMIVNGAVEVLARADNGLVVQSGPLLLTAGDELDFELGAQASLSSATVRPRLAMESPGPEAASASR